MRSTAAVLLTLAWAIPRPVTAQTQLEVAPHVGRYQPTTILGTGDGVPADAGDTVKHLGSVTWGVRVTKWGPGHLGVEATVGYAPSSLWSSFAYNGGPVYSARVVTVAATVLRQLTRPAARAALYVGGGLGVVGHFGSAYSNLGEPATFLGGVAKIGGRIKLGGSVGLRFDVEDFVYVAHLGPCTRTGPGGGGVCDVFGESAGRTTGSRLQNDLVLSFGLALAAGR